MTNLVLRRDTDGLCTLTLNRPEKLNALNVEMFVDLRAHVDDLADQTDSVGCVVFRGSGPCFSAGHDLMDIATGEEPPYPNFQSETIERLANLPQPVITAIHGHCYTGALELALAGDLIISSESARIADTHGRWALTPGWGMSQRLPRRVGTAKAKEMMFTSRIFTGQEAETMGLVNRCVPDDGFDQYVETLARSILANSWFSNQANKYLVDQTDGMRLKDGLRFEIESHRGKGPDAEKRLNAFTSRK
jgi:enoyl-CoA hydratase